MHYLLFYEVADDYLERRAQLRSAHLEKAWAASERGELVLAGRSPTLSMARCCCSRATPRPWPRISPRPIPTLPRAWSASGAFASGRRWPARRPQRPCASEEDTCSPSPDARNFALTQKHRHELGAQFRAWRFRPVPDPRAAKLGAVTFVAAAGG